MMSTAAGFYHDPPIWVGNKPPTLSATEDLSSLRDVMFRKKLSSGIELEVTREGLFGFSFSDWPQGIPLEFAPQAPMTFDDLVAPVVNQTLVMNSFLAFMYTNEISVSGRLIQRMVVTPELVITFSGSLDNNTGMGYRSLQVSNLALSNAEGTYNPLRPLNLDMRIWPRAQPIELEVIERSADNLEILMNSDHDDNLLVADLFLRASKSFQDHNYSAALIGYWSVTEKLIQELWQKYQEDNRTRDGEAFINGDRKKILEDGRSFTASVIMEVLSFAEQITLDLYQDATKVRKARNNWIHSLKSISSSEAVLAANVCEKLFKQVRKVTLNGAAPRGI